MPQEPIEPSNPEEPKLKNNQELSLLDKLSRAQELITDITESENQDESTKTSRIEDAKDAFLTEVPNVAELIFKLDAIGEKEVAQKLKEIFNL